MANFGHEQTFDMVANFYLRSVLLSAARYAATLFLGLALTTTLTTTLIVADAGAWLTGQFLYASGDALVAGVSGLFGWTFKVVFLVIAVSIVSAALRGVARTKGHYITYVLASVVAGSTLQFGTELLVGLRYFTIAALLLVPALALRVPTRVRFQIDLGQE